MAKHILQSFPSAQQQYDNSCWACCSRMINNYFALTGRVVPGLATYNSDDAITTAAQAPFIGNTAHMDSASALLSKLGYTNNIDDAHVPTLDELCDHLKTEAPLVSLLTTNPPPPINLGNINGALYGGHWVVIVGVDGNKLRIFDPANNNITSVTYNNTRCLLNGVNYYWGNTSYVDPASVQAPGSKRKRP